MTDVRQCAVPGCGRVVSAQARSGVCADHRHRAPYCACAQCAERAKRSLIDKARLRRMWAADMMLKDMAAEFGVSPGAVSVAARRLGLPKRAVGRRPLDIDEAVLRRMWADGATLREIADRLGVSADVVKGCAQRLGLPRHRVQRAGAARSEADVPGVARARARFVACEVPRPVARPAVAVPCPDAWSQDRDARIMGTKGRYALIPALARDWGIASGRIVARWHLLRAM